MIGDEVSCWAKRDDLAKGGGGGGGGGRRGGKAGGERGKFVPDFKNGCAICGDRNHWKLHVLTWAQLEIGWHQAGMAGEEVDWVGHQDWVVAGMVNF